MRIEYVCHSCLHIDTGDTTLVFDPWFKDGVYMNQWHLFPGPVKLSVLKNTVNILYSHGHEDHLHAGSLKEFPKETPVFYPWQWRRGAEDYFHSHGYEKLTEAISFRPQIGRAS